MKNLLLILICFLCFSCNNQRYETTNIRINHYQQTAIGVGQRLVYLVQEGDDIGTEHWEYFYANIVGFQYESGYIYNLNIEKHPIENPPADGSSVRFVLQEVISKEKVDPDISFQIRLKSASLSNPSSFVRGDADTGFNILNSIQINCNTLCNELPAALESSNELQGVFTHVQPGVIELKELIQP